MDNRRYIHISLPYIGEEEIKALEQPLASGWLTQGPNVAAFEKKFAEIHKVGHAIATSNCTTALHLSLVALGVGPGDEVILPSFTWIATANVVEYVGARPVFCDVNQKTYNIDPLQMESLITSKTKAVIPVHLFGLCADMDPIIQICQKHSLFIVEDAACAVGARYKDKMAGSMGNIGCFSFHPRKIITMGEGGMCTTSDPQLAEKLKCLRNHGASISEEERHQGPKPYILADFNMLGFNYRMTDLQGAVGVVQLARLEKLLKERQYWADWYREQLKDISWLELPKVPADCFHSYQAFVCYVHESRAPKPRNEIMEYLNAKSIATRPGTHSVHMLGYYRRKYDFSENDFPVSRDCYKYTIAIPLYNRMKGEDYKYVVETIKQIE